MRKKNSRRKSKKQPNRNALLKIRETRQRLEQELDEALSAKRESHLLNASLQREAEIARQATREAVDREARAKRYARHTRDELKHANKYHPFLMNEQYIGGELNHDISLTDILQYRIAAPTVDWDDRKRAGAVRMVFGRVNGNKGQVAYGLSEHTLYNTNYDDAFVDSLSKSVTKELFDLAKTKLKDY